MLRILALLLLSVNFAFASSIHFDIGQSSTVFNRFSIPKSDSSRLIMPNDESITNYRVTGYFDLASKNQLYIMLAPLEVSYSLNPQRSFRFNDTNFASGTNTDVSYKFNSYRLGYLWTWNTSTFRYWLGAVAKIRDAKISVQQGSSKDEFDNIGFVPLASIGFEWALTNNIAFFSHTDALGASQGSAYDSQLEIKYKMKTISASLGKRILGGGADNGTVYNFAQFDTTYLRVSTYF